MQQEPEPQYDDAESEPESAVSPVEILQFVINSTKRHPRMAVIVGSTIAAIGVGIGLIVPSRFDAESRILQVQSAALTSALTANESRLPNVDAFGGSAEILMQKSNLQWLIKQSELVSHWKATRPALFRWKDELFAALAGPPTEVDTVNALSDMLRARMSVYNDASILTIHVTWRDPDSAVKLAKLAQERFFELRRTQELGAITAAIELNEAEVKRTADAIDQSLDEVIKIRDKRRQESLAPPEPTEPPSTASTATAVTVKRRRVSVQAAAPASSAATTTPAPDRRMAARLADVRQREHDIEVPWQRRLAELKFQLADMRGSYGPEHPVVRQQEAKIREATEPPPELVALHDSERQLLAEIESEQQTAAAQASAVGTQRVTVDDAPGVVPQPQPNRAQTSAGTIVIAEREEDPVLAPAKARLQTAISTYSDASRRLKNAQSQMATSQVALQHRYVVVTEPERPRTPSKPNRAILILAGIFVGSLVGFLIGAIRDFVTGLVFESWQVRAIGLPVLGEVEVQCPPKPMTSQR